MPQSALQVVSSVCGLFGGPSQASEWKRSEEEEKGREEKGVRRRKSGEGDK